MTRQRTGPPHDQATGENRSERTPTMAPPFLGAPAPSATLTRELVQELAHFQKGWIAQWLAMKGPGGLVAEGDIPERAWKDYALGQFGMFYPHTARILREAAP